MIFLHREWEFCCASICILIPVVLTICSLYAYQVNSKRAPDDPKKWDHSPRAIWLAPFTLPPLVIFNLFLLILSSLVFGFFLVLFPFALLFFREPFLIKWLRKQALKIGNWALKINTELLRAAGFHPPAFRLLQK
jgi:hypothetical protein